MLSTTPENVVKVSVKVQKDFAPDTISVTINFGDELKDKDECLTQYNRDYKSVYDAVIRAGFDKRAISGPHVFISSDQEDIYEHIEEDNRYYRVKTRLIGYSYRGYASITIKATEENYKKIWQTLISAEGTFGFDVDFRLSREDEAEKILLEEAIKESRARAEILAKASGAELGKICNIEHRFEYELTRYKSTMPEISSYRDPNQLIPTYNPDDIPVECSVEACWRLD